MKGKREEAEAAEQASLVARATPYLDQVSADITDPQARLKAADSLRQVAVLDAILASGQEAKK